MSVFSHPDFQSLLNYEEVLVDLESDELYEIHKVGHEKLGDLIYKDATRKMKRKYDNYFYAKENFIPKRRNLYYGLT